MIYRTVSLLLGCLLLLGACKNHSQSTTTPPGTDSTSNQYFPIADFLQSEIRNIDTSALAILVAQTADKHTDTTYVTANQFNRVAAVFLMPELIPDSLEKYYEENSFSDKTTGYLTFTYSPRDKTKPLQRIDVMVGQNIGGANRVKSIYMERSGHEGDTLEIKKMYWQAGRSFEVVTNRQANGHAAGTRQLKVVWNPEEAE